MMKSVLLPTQSEKDPILRRGTSLNVHSQSSKSKQELRLGAKAILTQKIGGGVKREKLELLGGLQLKESLQDGKAWCTELAKTSQLGESPTDGRRICDAQVCSAADDLVESLGSLVEFDGLETTQDPSPRSSLMLSMYNQNKGTFVYRTLTERVIPSCDRFISAFGRRRSDLVQEYVRAEYSSEVPFEVLQQQLLSAE